MHFSVFEQRVFEIWVKRRRGVYKFKVYKCKRQRANLLYIYIYIYITGAHLNRVLAHGSGVGFGSGFGEGAE